MDSDGPNYEPVIVRAFQSESIIKFAAAFVAAQRLIKGATKDKTNAFFNNNRYADLTSVMEACKDSLNSHGIAIIQTPAPAPAGRLALTTKLLHESGEWMAGTGEIPIGKDGPQAYGSALTYARRYFLAAMVGVCPEDDDAEGAMDRTPPKQQQQQRPQKQPPSPPKQQDELSDDEKFMALLSEAFDAADFKPGERAAVNAKVCKAKKITGLARLSLADRHALMEAIVSGKFDNCKAKPEPAGV